MPNDLATLNNEDNDSWEELLLEEPRNWKSIANENDIPLWEKQPSEKEEEYRLWQNYCQARENYSASPLRDAIVGTAYTIEKANEIHDRWTYPSRWTAYVRYNDISADATSVDVELQQIEKRMQDADTLRLAAITCLNAILQNPGANINSQMLSISGTNLEKANKIFEDAQERRDKLITKKKNSLLINEKRALAMTNAKDAHEYVLLYMDDQQYQEADKVAQEANGKVYNYNLGRKIWRQCFKRIDPYKLKDKDDEKLICKIYNLILDCFIDGDCPFMATLWNKLGGRSFFYQILDDRGHVNNGIYTWAHDFFDCVAQQNMLIGNISSGAKMWNDKSRERQVAEETKRAIYIEESKISEFKKLGEEAFKNLIVQ